MAKVLYHYTSADTFINYISRENSLKVNHINNVNDPQEFCRLNFSLCSGGGKYVGASRVKNGSIKKADIDVHSKLFLLCFSYFDVKVGDGPQLHMLDNMWAHYADNHRGVSIAFSEETILDAVNKSNLTSLYMNPVDYSDNKTLTAKISTDNFTVDDSLSKYKSHIEKKYIEHLSYKNSNWSNEQEYRCLLKSRKPADSVKIFFDKALCIILGLKYQLKCNDPIFNYCIREEVPLYKVTFNNNSRKHEFKRIDKKTSGFVRC